MERREPTFVPEWLKSNSTVTGGGNSAHNFASSSSLSDFSSGHHGRQRNYRNVSDFDSHSSSFLDRSSSLNTRRSSSNGSVKHAYSSFSRSHRDKDRERDKVRLNFGDHWDFADSEPLESLLTSRVEIETLHRSNSMFSRKQDELLSRRVGLDARDSINGNHNNGNGLLSGGAVWNSNHKAVIERDFPLLGTEDRQVVPEITRVSSPGLSSASQNLPVGSSALISGDGWTSALAEAPSMVGSSNTGSLTTHLTVSTSSSVTPTGTFGLNMALALAQAPSRSHTAPQLSVKTQRRKELAIKQSKQLIPVTPSMPKGSVLNSVDKSKGKPVSRTSEINIAVKRGQQQPSLIHHGNLSPHGEQVKSDMPKTSGKFLVLKPGWENGVSSSTQKYVVSPTSMNTKVTVSTHAVDPARNSNSPKLSAGGHKAAALNSGAGFTAEKRPSLAQTKSRNDFFNLLKKKTSSKTSAVLSDSHHHIASSTLEKSEVTKEVVSASSTSHANENGIAETNIGDSCQEDQRFADDSEKDMGSASMIYPDEEEAAFLRSLGWEENSGEDEGLTEEEINAFYQEYMKLRPSLKLSRAMQPKLAQSFATDLDGAASELSSSDSGSEA
ncbi:Mitogen-activated protein kinase kinase kinase 1, putative isoform 1 [Hibiscus syriacus]|uniref:Mitogen-activated protein kinase kinase kinase 1, putative isoform 1 n=1 Tax=Hibiscus syriacus TaxID=106335 RepID=A0A6A3AAU6_HIBSY|nr:Mitogen-activated protein kinase kinase kinase 1, putative isoform 1 [Hibiscus syriacus]